MMRFIGVSVLLLVFTGSASAIPFTNLFNFGDSFSDTGNVSFATGGFPPPPYAPGRFTSNFTDDTDGTVWYDVAASQLGFSSANSLSGGNNYAFAGARTGPLGAGFPPSLLDQTLTFLTNVGGVADSGALYSVWGGGNDIRDNDIGNSVANISSVISSLHLAGAMNFFIPNQPDIGLTPESVAGDAPGGAAADITAASLLFNLQLEAELQSLEANLGVNIIKFDLSSIFDDVISNPADFGFSNVTDSCFNGLTLCADPDSYLFFDGIHPTAAAHTIIGNFAVAAIMDAMDVSAPATLAMFLLGLAVIGFRRNKV